MFPLMAEFFFAIENSSIAQYNTDIYRKQNLRY